MIAKPKSVNILGVDYAVTYVDNPAEVDIFKRKSLWGQIDPWTRTIRIYDNGRPLTDTLETILHEVLEGVAMMLHLKVLEDEDNHDTLDMVALALADVMVRNGWVTLEAGKE